MGPQRGWRTANKAKRRELHIFDKKAAGKSQRETRFRRKKEEEKDPELRRARQERNKPITLDKKRKWDDVDDDSLGVVVDMEQLKKRRLQQAKAEQASLIPAEEDGGSDESESEEDDDDSLLGLDSDLDSDEEDEEVEEDGDEGSDEGETASKTRKRGRKGKPLQESPEREPSQTPSVAPSLAYSATNTNLDLIPSALRAKFPTLFPEGDRPVPKLLVTTSLQSTLHKEAEILTSLFPKSVYIRRSAHRYAHKYSLREISRFAANRNFTAVLVLHEDQKRPSALSVVHLPSGPTFHFSIGNWIEGKRLPGHGRPTVHDPELLLNNFRTPLGVLTARLFESLFPPRPQFAGRQVVTLHNQRDYIFVRRHRYVFRDRKETEKGVVDAEGKELKWARGVRTGLQELGPRFTLKLRRVDKGVGRAGSEGEDAVQWEWKAGMEKDRKRFNL